MFDPYIETFVLFHDSVCDYVCFTTYKVENRFHAEHMFVIWNSIRIKGEVSRK